MDKAPQSPAFDPMAVAQQRANYDKQHTFEHNWLGMHGGGNTPEQVAQAAQDTVDYMSTRPEGDVEAFRAAHSEGTEPVPSAPVSHQTVSESLHNRVADHYHATMGEDTLEARHNASNRDLIQEWAEAEARGDVTAVHEITSELYDRFFSKVPDTEGARNRVAGRKEIAAAAARYQKAGQLKEHLLKRIQKQDTAKGKDEVIKELADKAKSEAKPKDDTVVGETDASGGAGSDSGEGGAFTNSRADDVPQPRLRSEDKTAHSGTEKVGDKDPLMGFDPEAAERALEEARRTGDYGPLCDMWDRLPLRREATPELTAAERRIRGLLTEEDRAGIRAERDNREVAATQKALEDALAALRGDTPDVGPLVDLFDSLNSNPNAPDEVLRRVGKGLMGLSAAEAELFTAEMARRHPDMLEDTQPIDFGELNNLLISGDWEKFVRDLNDLPRDQLYDYLDSLAPANTTDDERAYAAFNDAVSAVEDDDVLQEYWDKGSVYDWHNDDNGPVFDGRGDAAGEPANNNTADNVTGATAPGSEPRHGRRFQRLRNLVRNFPITEKRLQAFRERSHQIRNEEFADRERQLGTLDNATDAEFANALDARRGVRGYHDREYVSAEGVVTDPDYRRVPVLDANGDPVMVDGQPQTKLQVRLHGSGRHARYVDVDSIRTRYDDRFRLGEVSDERRDEILNGMNRERYARLTAAATRNGQQLPRPGEPGYEEAFERAAEGTVPTYGIGWLGENYRVREAHRRGDRLGYGRNGERVLRRQGEESERQHEDDHDDDHLPEGVEGGVRDDGSHDYRNGRTGRQLSAVELMGLAAAEDEKSPEGAGDDQTRPAGQNMTNGGRSFSPIRPLARALRGGPDTEDHGLDVVTGVRRGDDSVTGSGSAPAPSGDGDGQGRQDDRFAALADGIRAQRAAGTIGDAVMPEVRVTDASAIADRASASGFVRGPLSGTDFVARGVKHDIGNVIGRGGQYEVTFPSPTGEIITQYLTAADIDELRNRDNAPTARID